jgi:hypothetical protein
MRGRADHTTPRNAVKTACWLVSPPIRCQHSYSASRSSLALLANRL